MDESPFSMGRCKTHPTYMPIGFEAQGMNWELDGRTKGYVFFTISMLQSLQHPLSFRFSFLTKLNSLIFVRSTVLISFDVTTPPPKKRAPRPDNLSLWMACNAYGGRENWWLLNLDLYNCRPSLTCFNNSTEWPDRSQHLAFCQNSIINQKKQKTKTCQPYVWQCHTHHS